MHMFIDMISILLYKYIYFYAIVVLSILIQ